MPAYAAALPRPMQLARAGRRQCFLRGSAPTRLHLRPDADFAVLPSRSESGPLVLIEYMALGLPFVATNGRRRRKPGMRRSDCRSSCAAGDAQALSYGDRQSAAADAATAP